LQNILAESEFVPAKFLPLFTNETTPACLVISMYYYILELIVIVYFIIEVALHEYQSHRFVSMH
ncbi:MAG: hypothetical protein K0Q87_4004, partial [Neobacillus sp.]|nr:hypothetical protein [Neobacillus sp.]